MVWKHGVEQVCLGRSYVLSESGYQLKFESVILLGAESIPVYQAGSKLMGKKTLYARVLCRSDIGWGQFPLITWVHILDIVPQKLLVQIFPMAGYSWLLQTAGLQIIVVYLMSAVLSPRNIHTLLVTLMFFAAHTPRQLHVWSVWRKVLSQISMSNWGHIDMHILWSPCDICFSSSVPCISAYLHNAIMHESWDPYLQPYPYWLGVCTSTGCCLQEFLFQLAHGHCANGAGSPHSNHSLVRLAFDHPALIHSFCKLIWYRGSTRIMHMEYFFKSDSLFTKTCRCRCSKLICTCVVKCTTLGCE